MKYDKMIEEQAKTLLEVLDDCSDTEARVYLAKFALTAIVDQFNNKITALEAAILKLTKLIAPEHIEQARKAVHNLPGGKDGNTKQDTTRA